MGKYQIDGKELLITGGSGSIGKALTELLLEKHKIRGMRIFSRGELLQWEMRNMLYSKYGNQIPVSFLIGDVRDRKRVELATRGVNLIIHCAALKQVPVCEDAPLEAINTNIIGSHNILYASLENKIENVIFLSTDKAAAPANLYGATKMVAEKLFVQGNTYSGGKSPKFSCVRYGNVLGSRGSIVPLFKKRYKEAGIIPITHHSMTRFWITLKQAAQFILNSIEDMQGGEIFVPMMPSAKVEKIAKAIAPNAPIKYIGIRPGEKLHEILVTKEESRKTLADHVNNRFIIRDSELGGPEFSYRSEKNSDWLSTDQIRKMINE